MFFIRPQIKYPIFYQLVSLELHVNELNVGNLWLMLDNSPKLQKLKLISVSNRNKLFHIFWWSNNIILIVLLSVILWLFSGGMGMESDETCTRMFVVPSWDIHVDRIRMGTRRWETSGPHTSSRTLDGWRKQLFLLEELEKSVNLMSPCVGMITSTLCFGKCAM